jgi:hypothetical protein
VARDASFAAAYARRLRDPASGGRLHDSSISRAGRRGRASRGHIGAEFR